jgi:pimeloyl-ACP methyl ester carboxylesterase
MPFADGRSMTLYYESAGSGPPVLLVSGQGMTRSDWWRTVPVLARRFRVLCFDNRDTGRSKHSAWPYTVAQMADDAIAVLNAAGEERAHVYGMSLGGMVAQEIALRHADRVAALVLGSTTPGGLQAVLPDPHMLTFFVRVGWMGAEEAEWAAVAYKYGEATRRERQHLIAEDIAHRDGFPADALAYLHQMGAASSYNPMWRLREIGAPTLVVHGDEDAVVPPVNARRLAEAIPNSELMIWPGAGHLYATDEPRADREILRFLLRHPEALGQPAQESADYLPSVESIAALSAGPPRAAVTASGGDAVGHRSASGLPRVAMPAAMRGI